MYIKKILISFFLKISDSPDQHYCDIRSMPDNYIYDKLLTSKNMKLFSYELCFKVLRTFAIYLTENFRFGRDSQAYKEV